MFISCLSLFLGICSTNIALSNSAIHAAFWLILTFFLSAVEIWIIDLNFFSLIYIIIYVGAITVLFLFVIMMLDIKQFQLVKIYDFNILIESLKRLFILFIIFFISFFLISETYLYENNLEETFIFFFETFDLINGLEIFGQVLYNFYYLYIGIAGLILLVAVIGSIVLTINQNIHFKIKLTSRQLARSDNFLIFFR